MKLRTTEMLLDAVDEDLAWRKKELATLKFAIDRSRNKPRLLRTALRAGIALLYAHWEGFLKASSEHYLEFVSWQSLNNGDLADNFLALVARKPIHAMTESSKVAQGIGLVEFFRTKLKDPALIPHKDAVRTRSNLSSEVLRDISLLVGINFSLFETKSTLIDERLVHKRNSIAHGQYLEIDVADYEQISHEIATMMETWRNEIENACVMKRYVNTTS